MYVRFGKRFLDIAFSLTALIILTPFLLFLSIVGMIKMKGNPFFIQERPGWNERIFKLIKFRTMTCAKGKDGQLLPDCERLTRYGIFLRSTSMDELPELFNILKGDMTIIGPRPLLIKYLPLYSQEQRHRHDVRPGLTGYAQIHGRNAISWEEKFELDLFYVKNISLWLDIKILLKTISTVLNRSDINSNTAATMEEFKGAK